MLFPIVLITREYFKINNKAIKTVNSMCSYVQSDFKVFVCKAI